MHNPKFIFSGLFIPLMRFGYFRVRTKSQNTNLQIGALLKEGVSYKDIYQDVSSGARKVRHKLDLMISKLWEGDTVIMWKLDRIARGVSHLLKLAEKFERLGVKFKSINHPFMNATTPFVKFILTIFGAIAQLTRDIIKERTMAGLQSSKKKGIHLVNKRA